MTIPADLSTWTPVALSLDDPEPSVDWCDMTGERFSDPFFSQTVSRLTKGVQARPTVRTPLGVLMELDGAPSLEPCGLVFHMGRCGSTLVARLLGLIPGVVAVREPQPVNTLLQAAPSRIGATKQIEILRALIRALGRVRFGDERHLVIKLSSWNVCKAPLFRLAFPEVPMVWMQRRPIEVMASMIEGPPTWLTLRNHPEKAAQIFGVDPGELAGIDGFEYAARLLASMLDAAADTHARVIDYKDLPGAVPDTVAPYFGLAVTGAVRALMEKQARYHAKSANAVSFSDDSERKRVVPARAVAVSSALLDKRYAALDTRRSGRAIGPAQ